MDRLFLHLRGASSTVDDDCELLLADLDGMYLALLFMAVFDTYSRCAWRRLVYCFVFGKF